MNPDSKEPESTKIVLYQAADGNVTVNVTFARDTFWLTQKAMAELFGVKVPAINKHLKNIFDSGELVAASAISILETTAAEIVYRLADSAKPFMGLTTWKNAPKGKVLKGDVVIAKNYLNQAEVDKLNRLVVMFIDFAELRALNRQVMTMKDWLKQVKRFLDFNEQQALAHAGKISHEMAVAKAHQEFEKYRVLQDQQYISDFDEAFALYLKGGEKQ